MISHHLLIFEVLVEYQPYARSLQVLLATNVHIKVSSSILNVVDGVKIAHVLIMSNV